MALGDAVGSPSVGGLRHKAKRHDKPVDIDWLAALVWYFHKVPDSVSCDSNAIPQFRLILPLRASASQLEGVHVS